MFKNLSTSALGVSGQTSELIEWTLSYGFRGLDLELNEFVQRVEASGMQHARRLFDSARLRFGCFELPLDLESDEATFAAELAALAPKAKLAAEVGCTRATRLIAPANDERPYHANFELLRQRLLTVAGVLQPLGIRLGLGVRAAAELRAGKAFEFIHSFDALLVLLGMVNSPTIGAVVDSWELAVSGGKSEEVRKLAAAKIIAVQLADAPADVPLGDCPATARLLPGETGVVDNAGLLLLLGELGYDGPVTPVPHRSQFANQKRDAIVRAAGQKLDEVWKAAGLSPNGKLATAPAS